MSRASASRTPNSKIHNKIAGGSRYPNGNPFDSDSDTEQKTKSTRASSAPAINRPIQRGIRSNYNGFRSDSDDFEGQTVQELEKYAVNQAEETTQKINASLKVAEEIREVSSRTLVNLHQQGEQITRTHQTAINIDQDLSRGEKLLGSLGGLFKKTWKPKKSRDIKGPMLTRDDSFIRTNNRVEQRQKLGLESPRSRSNPRQYNDEPSSALERVEVEKGKQEDGLSDLSNILGELKTMAQDMGSEIDRQNKALDHMQEDVQELNYRVEGANARARRLLGR